MKDDVSGNSAPPRPAGRCTIAITQRKNGQTYITVAEGKSITYQGGGPGEAPTIQVEPLPANPNPLPDGRIRG